jgi:hypothetical protein
MNGVQVVLKDGREGYITRRLDSRSYEIWLEDCVVVLSPDEFEEKEKDE